jgi:hypothetical protein
VPQVSARDGVSYSQPFCENQAAKWPQIFANRQKAQKPLSLTFFSESLLDGEG